jgi:hypothetical protein
MILIASFVGLKTEYHNIFFMPLLPGNCLDLETKLHVSQTTLVAEIKDLIIMKLSSNMDARILFFL